MKTVTEASFKTSLKLLFVFLPSLQLSAQVPDYELGLWTEGDFESSAVEFFRVLTLQISSEPSLVTGREGTFSIGGDLSTAWQPGSHDIAMISGKAGVLPAFSGAMTVTHNLALLGWYSGFVSDEDIVSGLGIGAAFLLARDENGPPNWNVTLSQRSLYGPDDFFLKTVGVAIFRRIDLRLTEVWGGIVSDYFNAGVHVSNQESGTRISKRIKGQVNALAVRFGIPLGSQSSVSLGFKVNSSFAALSLGIETSSN
ncbi:MAG: hypothetical protein QF551_07415 [Candidatus Marinimicrobia bacterium]|nr:hypothetical protein [Candidatus Neomarinimicrobiota bacterium]MDP6967084.1 hypothetical protein [Candidatus Neomarinimicrobiota bacterium]